MAVRVVWSRLLIKRSISVFSINSVNTIIFKKYREFSLTAFVKYNMAPLPLECDAESIKKLIDENDHVMFSLSHCPYCIKAKEMYKKKAISALIIEADQTDKLQQIKASLYEVTGQRTFPNIFAYGNHLGGCDDVHLLDSQKKFDQMMLVYKERKLLEKSSATFDYDAAVIGGGSGGIAFAKEMADNGKKVVLFDYVVPSPLNTKWGLGGTCVNVGCIPKKLMHQAAIHGENIKKSEFYGYKFDRQTVVHDWFKMTDTIHSHIRGLNFGYRSALNTKNVKYINALANLSGKHEITYVDSKKQVNKLTSKYIVLATGERPQYPDIPGENYCITSDDLFWLKYPPGKVLIVGASYVALECAGALHGMGYDVTVMVRSIFLRGYDQEMADRVGAHLESIGVKFIRYCVPLEVTCLKEVDTEKQLPGLLKVMYKNVYDKGKISDEEFNTVMFAIGRVSCTKNIGLETVGIPLDSKQRVLSVDDFEQTSVANIFAVGDILASKPQLTPVAIKAGYLLARRLCGLSFENCSYNTVPTTVFTPLEYGCVGYSEEDAYEKFGKENIDVYFNYCEPLEESVVGEENHEQFYAKIICKISEANKVIGLHIVSPNAGEVVQGYAVAVKMGATLTDFSRTFGIHPTVSEVFTNMKISKQSGKSVTAGGC